MQTVNSGPAFLMGLVTGVPSFAYAFLQNETLPIIAGIATGVIGLGWSIYRSSNDQRFETITKRIDEAEKEADRYRLKLEASNNENIAVKNKEAETSGNYELLKKRLATHVCPLPADPATKCTLPDIINITL